MLIGVYNGYNIALGIWATNIKDKRKNVIEL